MRCYAAAERCSLILACLRAKCTSKLGALLGLWPGKSVNLDLATSKWIMMQRHRNSKKQQPWCICWIAELLPWENSKLMSVVQAKLPISNINQTVPHAARSWQGTIQSCSAGEGCCSSGDLELIGYRRDDCQLEFWNLCQETFQKFHRETLQQDQQDGPQGNWSWLVHKIFPLDLQLAWFSSCWNPPSLTFMSGVGTAQPRRRFQWGGTILVSLQAPGICQKWSQLDCITTPQEPLWRGAWI